MFAPVSIVIPTWQSADRIGPCVGALTEGLMAGLVHELILADGGSDDAIDEVAEALGARLVALPPGVPCGRGPQLAAGAATARGDWLLFLHADTVLAPGWPAAVRAHIEDRPERAGYFALRFDAPGAMARLVAGWANLRARLLGLPFGDQGLLISRTLYARAGGYPPIPLMEDVALVRRLGRRRLAPLGATATTSAERYVSEGWLSRGARNLGNQVLYFLGVPPERLAARYQRGE